MFAFLINLENFIQDGIFQVLVSLSHYNLYPNNILPLHVFLIV